MKANQVMCLRVTRNTVCKLVRYISSVQWEYDWLLTGVPALTSRQFKEADFVKVVELLDRGVAIASQAKDKSGIIC
jgi:hypothetical protein